MKLFSDACVRASGRDGAQCHAHRFRRARRHANARRNLYSPSADVRAPEGTRADVIVRKYAREVQYAKLDFVSGAVLMCADDGGFVMVPSRVDLEPFLTELPKLVDELKNLVHQREAELQQATGSSERTVGAGDMISVPFGPNQVSVAPGTNVIKFVGQVTQRFREIKLVLKQAEEIGQGIKRRPYSEYTDGIEKTGICSVESHGFAYFVDGRLIFYPDYKVGYLRPAGETTFELLSVDSNPSIESHRPN
jgi:hypothetical protein